jgi:hypothetical protein
MNLAQALNALRNLAEQLNIPGGLDGWEKLLKQMERNGDYGYHEHSDDNAP